MAEPVDPPRDAPETIFTYAAPPLKFGAGASDELGHDLGALGATRVLLLTDPGVAATGIPNRIADGIRRAGIDVLVYDGVRVEPTDQSLRQAVADAEASGPWDAFVAVGGGSSIDTAKAVNLLTSCGGDLLDYVNAPIGAGLAPTRRLKPLVAVPTTSGTGSESTAVCVLDVLSLRVKTGISHPRLRPTLAVVDPLLTLTLPPEVTAASGMDILCHALESFTAKPFDEFAARRPQDRVAYCGANPVGDLWARYALTLLAQSLRRAVRNGHEDVAARTDLVMAATFAGMGFGNAGVHIPHANGYPIAGRVRDYRPPGYPQDHPMVPHGISVVLTAPEAFRFTFPARPQRHVQAARLLAPAMDRPAQDADYLPAAVIALCRDLGLPNGIGAVGYGEGDLADLVDGAVRQHRLLALSPRAVTPDDLAGIFERSITNW
jgi:hydroxyacid-oxoacid transhydrogenase